MRVVCLDFETANYFRGSICSIGAAVIEGDKVVERKSFIIKPHASCCAFNPKFVKIHGISKEMVKSQQEFDEIYPEFGKLLEGSIIAAHSAGFDVSALENVMTLYSIPFPRAEYICTLELSRKVWKNLPSYSLREVGCHIGHEFKHHDANEDAFACAKIILKALEINRMSSLPDLVKKERITMNKIYPGKPHVPAKMDNVSKFGNIPVGSIKPTTNSFDENNPLFGKGIVFTGELTTISRQEAMQQAVNVGAKLNASVIRETSYLVEGKQDPKSLKDGISSSKTKKAKELIAAGYTINIIHEEEFNRLLENTNKTIEAVEAPAVCSVDKVVPIKDFDKILTAIKGLGEKELLTMKGLKISFRLTADGLEVIKNGWKVTFKDLEKAYQLWPVKSMKEFTDAKIESSGTYLWAILNAVEPKNK